MCWESVRGPYEFARFNRLFCRKRLNLVLAVLAGTGEEDDGTVQAGT